MAAILQVVFVDFSAAKESTAKICHAPGYHALSSRQTSFSFGAKRGDFGDLLRLVKGRVERHVNNFLLHPFLRKPSKHTGTLNSAVDREHHGWADWDRQQVRAGITVPVRPVGS